MPSPADRVEAGRTGRILYGRIHPNEDLVESVETLCTDAGFAHALVRGSLGSLAAGCVETPSGQRIEMAGPAVEVLTLTGEVRTQGGAPHARLMGMLVDMQGQVSGGRVVRGRNPVCVTFEITLEEWVPA